MYVRFSWVCFNHIIYLLFLQRLEIKLNNYETVTVTGDHIDYNGNDVGNLVTLSYGWSPPESGKY